MSEQYDVMLKSIISQQELIIGPVAIEEANKVPGLKVSPDGKTISIEGEGKIVLEGLVKQYASLFGRVSVEVCREAVMSTVGVQKDNLPEILR